MPIGELIHQRPGLMQLTADVSQWDQSVLDLVDVNQYTRETVLETQDHDVNIMFEQTAEE